MKSASTEKGLGVVHWRGLLFALSLFALLSAAAGAGMAYWVVARYTLHMPLQTQALKVRLPTQLPVQVELLPPGGDGAAAPAATELREFPIYIDENFRTVVRVDTRVPIRMDVPFKGEVPVNITLPLNTRIRTRVLGINMELPIEGEVPLRFNLPVDLMIPINQNVRMKFDLPVNTRINQSVNVKMPTQQAARISLHDPSLNISMERSEITVPLSWLSLVENSGREEVLQLGPLVMPPQKSTE